MRRSHAHVGGVHGRWRCRPVRSAGRTRVVLRPTPAQTHARVANRIALHLVDGHLGGVTLDELHETAALARRDLDVGDFAKALEERAKLILCHVARQTANEHRGVVGIRELVHRLRGTIVTHRRTTHRRIQAGRARNAHTRGVVVGALVLGRRGRDAHRTVAAVDTLHLGQSALLIVLIGEADETVSTGHAGDRIGHNLGGLARREAALEQRHENVFGDLRTKVTDEDRVLGTTVLAATDMVSRRSRQGQQRKGTNPRSDRPPPVAQFSRKVRVVLGMGVPFRVKALAAA